MAYCEDYLCCGHEAGCCPDYDESGRQLNMRCTCGAVLPLDNGRSICDTCLERDEEDYDDYDEPYYYEREIMEDQWLDGMMEE